MTFSFLWWLSIAKAPKKKKKERERETSARYEYITDRSRIDLRLAFLIKEW